MPSPLLPMLIVGVGNYWLTTQIPVWQGDSYSLSLAGLAQPIEGSTSSVTKDIFAITVIKAVAALFVIRDRAGLIGTSRLLDDSPPRTCTGGRRMRIKTVAFIGVGAMGAPMARRARQAGFDVLICARRQAVLDAFAAEGTRVTRDIADCAAADAVIVLLANDAQIMAAILGDAGVARAIPPGRRPIVCVMSTTLPDTLQALQAGLNDTGARLIDAPISGGVVGAEQGTLSIMLGGDVEDVTDVTPLMESMGSKIFHCGPLGSGEVIKVINNILCVANMFLTAEAVQLAEAHGVAFEALSPILSVSSGLNFLTADAAIGRAQYGAWARSEEAYQATFNIVSKDLHLALKLADLAKIAPGLLLAISSYVDTNDPEAMERWMHCGGVR